MVDAAAGTHARGLLQARTDRRDRPAALLHARPSRLAARPPFARKLRPIAFSIPEEKIVAEPPAKTKLFNAHVVDAEVAERIGATDSYSFEREAEYYADLQASLRGHHQADGWDALRHYELAANGCVPCFRLLEAGALCSARSRARRNCLSYTDAEDLLRPGRRRRREPLCRASACALTWARANSTRARHARFWTSLDSRCRDRLQAPVDAVVVTWNSRETALRCLEHLAVIPVERILVDNASADGTADAVRSGHGWTGGAREGTRSRGRVQPRRARGRRPRVLFLNDDVSWTTRRCARSWPRSRARPRSRRRGGWSIPRTEHAD